MKKKSETKKQSYKKLKKSGRLPALDAEVLAAIQSENLTREEISVKIDARLSSVCGAANRLLKAKRIVEVGSKKNPDTGFRNNILAPFYVEVSDVA